MGSRVIRLAAGNNHPLESIQSYKVHCNSLTHYHKHRITEQHEVHWSEGVASLNNNEPVVLMDVDFGDTVLHSFQLDEEASIDVQTSNAPHAVQLFDVYGNALMNCSAPCDFELIPAGDYFLRLTVDAPADEMAFN